MSPLLSAYPIFLLCLLFEIFEASGELEEYSHVKAHLKDIKYQPSLAFNKHVVWRSLEVQCMFLIIRVQLNTCVFKSSVYGIWIAFVKVWFLLLVGILDVGIKSFVERWEANNLPQGMTSFGKHTLTINVFNALYARRQWVRAWGAPNRPLAWEKCGLPPAVSHQLVSEWKREAHAIDECIGCLSPDIMSKNTSTERQAYARRLGVKELSPVCLALPI